MSMDLSPADYVLRALPIGTVEFPIILFSLVGMIGTVLAYATIFSEDGKDATGGIDFTDFGLDDLGFSDSPRPDEPDSYDDAASSSKDDSYGFGFGSSDAKDNDTDPYRRGGGKSKRCPRNGGRSASARRKKQ
jgi:hypothetical protein